MKNFVMIFSILLFTLLLALSFNFITNKNYNKTPVDAINKFQNALESGDTNKLMETYCTNLLNPPRIITNVPKIYESKVWPWHRNSKEDIPIGDVITGLDELKKYQESVFKDFSFHKLTSNIISLDVYDKSAVAIIYGTHKIVGKPSSLHYGEIKYTQAQEMWHLVKCKTKGWCVQNIAFIDKVR